MPSKLGVGDSASSWFVSQDSTLIQAVFVVKGFFWWRVLELFGSCMWFRSSESME